MTSTSAQTWSARADTAQQSLDHFFGVPGIQFLANSHPHDRGNTCLLYTSDAADEREV